MHFDIFTLFPEMFQGPFTESILKRAQERGLLSIALHNIRDATTDKHHVVDDYPYGGGAGMVMKPDPLFAAVESIYLGGPIILLTPQGRPFTQQIARELSQQERITLLCGHYEGIDERVRQHLVTDELSLGDYVLFGGEVAVLVIMEAVVRLLPGVLGNAESLVDESHADGLLEAPGYTKPPVWRDLAVPEILRSGDHGRIARWRRDQALLRTAARRPDLLAALPPEALDKHDRAVLAGAGFQISAPDMAK